MVQHVQHVQQVIVFIMYQPLYWNLLDTVPFYITKLISP